MAYSEACTWFNVTGIEEAQRERQEMCSRTGEIQAEELGRRFICS